ncbi:MAG TPA: hypothetical protein VFN88_03590 [Caulobacteraceae bacterium]|nr:hypothetical protein [Caulobacteraceae bacterium]
MAIDPRHAEIHWRDQHRDGRFEVAEVEVFDRRSPRQDRPELDNSAGACCADWLSGADPRSTPEGLYVQWVHEGFVDDAAHLSALRELAKIDGLAWAQTMAAALALHLRAEDPELG